MKSILQTRWMRWRIEWKSILVWLLLPILLTLILINMIDSLSDESKVPVGLVVEEETDMAAALVRDISSTNLLDVHFLQRREALHKLETHELDSVFVIRRGYEKSILANQRNQLIEAYASNRSFAYPIVTEIISSFAQQDASRSKAAFEVKHLYKIYGLENQWQWDEIVEESRIRQQNEALLTTEFSYQNSNGRIQEKQNPLLKTWGIWALLTVLATFFLFDWVLKENTTVIRPRWRFTTFSFTQYASLNLILYTLLLMTADLFSAAAFHFFLEEPITKAFIFSLLIFRITLNLFVFLLATQYKQLLLYFVSAIAITLLLGLLGGAIIPLDGIMKAHPWLTLKNPIYHLLNESIPLIWLSLGIALLGLWLWKGDQHHA